MGLFDFLFGSKSNSGTLYSSEEMIQLASKWTTFKLLNVKYQAHIDLGGGETATQMWDFPINMSREDMLSIIKKKADEWDNYGILK